MCQMATSIECCTTTMARLGPLRIRAVACRTRPRSLNVRWNQVDERNPIRIWNGIPRVGGSNQAEQLAARRGWSPPPTGGRRSSRGPRTRQAESRHQGVSKYPRHRLRSGVLTAALPAGSTATHIEPRCARTKSQVSLGSVNTAVRGGPSCGVVLTVKTRECASNAAKLTGSCDSGSGLSDSGRRTLVSDSRTSAPITPAKRGGK